jgi:hypothetical protein
MFQRLYLLTPVLYGLFPIISLYSQNLNQVIPADALEPVITVTIGILVLMLVAGRLIKDTQKMVLLVALFVILFFLHGYFYYISFKMLGFQNQWVILAAWLLAFSSIAYLILRTLYSSLST